MNKVKTLSTFVITMPGEVGRQKKAKKQLKGICDNYEFFRANAKPNKFPATYVSWKRQFYFGRDLSLGEFGCFNSHKLVLEKIISKKIEKALILEDDFIFLDPPYDCVFSDYGNVEYKDGFNEKSHTELANAYKELNCKALMVIGRTPLTEKLYGEMIVDEYEKSYAVNIRNRFKSEASHILISNYGNEALKREPKLILEEKSISYG